MSFFFVFGKTPGEVGFCWRQAFFYLLAPDKVGFDIGRSGEVGGGQNGHQECLLREEGLRLNIFYLSAEPLQAS